MWGEDSEPAIFIKAAVSAANTQDSDWAGSVAGEVGYEFIEVVRERSITGQLQMRAAPLSTRLTSMSTGTSAYWRGEARPAPVTSGVFTNSGLPPLGLSALAVISKELLKFGAANSELWIRSELVRASVALLDSTFMSTASAVADVSPAGVLQGVSGIAATTDVAYDLRELVETFAGDLTTASVVMRPHIAAALNSFEHPNIGARGGEILGLPVITSRYVPDETISLIDGEGIAFGDDGVTIDIAEHASVEMLDSGLEQDGTDGTGATTAGMVSLWQSDNVGILVTRRINWAKMRPCVAWLDNVEYRKVSA
ncbi:phage major capsid protein [Marinicaulis aureus]|uniref:Phage major capsid protein n=1 Tax=Hyphococcus aureus TaxID=2666033 RepID=A0ABW1L0A9_9PROT